VLVGGGWLGGGGWWGCVSVVCWGGWGGVLGVVFLNHFFCKNGVFLVLLGEECAAVLSPCFVPSGLPFP